MGRWSGIMGLWWIRHGSGRPAIRERWKGESVLFEPTFWQGVTFEISTKPMRGFFPGVRKRLGWRSMEQRNGSPGRSFEEKNSLSSNLFPKSLLNVLSGSPVRSIRIIMLFLIGPITPCRLGTLARRFGFGEIPGKFRSFLKESGSRLMLGPRGPGPGERTPRTILPRSWLI